MLPLRAPTMRSVPEIVSAKLWRAPVRTFSTPSSSIDAEGDGQHREQAVSARLRSDCRARRGRWARHDHAAALRSETAISSRRSTRSKRAPSCSSWLTMMTERTCGLAPRRTADRGRRAAGRDRAPRSARRRRSAPGAPMRARAAATRCCCPTLRFAAESPADAAASRPRLSSSRRASSSADPLRDGPLATIARKAQGQHHVVEDRTIGQQVEHLEDDAEVLGAEAIARGVRQPCQVGAEHLDAARPTA